MRRTLSRRGFCAAALLAVVGCDRRKVDVGPGDVPLSEFSANLSAGDLLDPATAEGRVGTYLDELAAAGYKRQVRIILPPDWGPRIYQHWFPAIRARGFKVLAILGQERRDSAADEPVAAAWIRHVLPLVRDYSFTPQDYGAYHRRAAALVREFAPGVPIVAGDFGVPAKGQNTLDGWKAMVAAGATDYDVLSIHVTGWRKEGELRDFAARLRAFGGPGRVWVTEGDWGQLRFLREQGVAVEEHFIYTWNDDALPALIRRPGGRMP